MKIFKFLVLSLCVALSLQAKDATMEIVKRMQDAPSIVLQDGTSNSFDPMFKGRFFKMLVADFKTTTHFNPVDKYLISSYDARPNLALTEKKPSLVLQYKLEHSNTGGIVVFAKFINAKNFKVISEKLYDMSSKDRYPFAAHRLVSDINDAINAPSVGWMKRYVIFSKNVAAMNTQIVIADYTLTFQKVIVKNGLNIFPKWANDKQTHFYYSSYSDPKPTLYKVQLNTGERRKIISSEGMLVCSDVSKDGNKVLLTMAPQGQADIYSFDVNAKNLKRITNYKGIDVNGGYVDNDTRIVFVSDRLGYPNIFAKNVNGRGVEQMVYHGKNNSASSSHGKYIVYSSRDKNSEFGPSTFNLYLISTQTDYIRQLTATGKNMFPRFSSDGDSILFIKEYGGQSALGLIRLNENKTFHFALKVGKIQSIDW